MIVLNDVSKTFDTPSGPLQAIVSASLEIEKSDIYGIIGFSGAGKSTLLRTINLLEKPDKGTVLLEGDDLTQLPRQQLLKKRMKTAMVFQHFNLLTNRTVFNNVSLPLEISGYPKKQRKERILECLEIVDLLDKVNEYPTKLSGGQKQRVAIARALANNPKVLLCDEPTSAVDPQTKESILYYLKQINEKLGITIVIVTHEMNVVKSICHKVAVMEKGTIVEKFHMNDKSYKPLTNISKILLGESNPVIESEVVYV
ncbi:methionine ABC transporter ATP-binding protein [Paenibacillus sp. GCM10012307]|uniref:ATP-binding cassette domain-containing protein n=1 Tax=Paenibacillus roseus TaxID=2798579 RepID=A0A934J830_9BACL|nr:methionine ABC transporter ATP-binding protein [Paenibacillus roseus]MBJ6362436.1 ATP-binding cassette domain-containing protein [Paenibacillus roseus]